MPYERSEERRALDERSRRSGARGKVREPRDGVRTAREEIPRAAEVAVFADLDLSAYLLLVSETPPDS